MSLDFGRGVVTYNLIKKIKTPCVSSAQGVVGKGRNLKLEKQVCCISEFLFIYFGLTK